MQSVDSRPNHLRSDSAVTARALANARDSSYFILGSGKSAEEPPIRAVGNPSLFPICGSNPDASASVSFFDQKRPLGIKLDDISIIDGFSTQWVHNNKIVDPKDQLGSNPQQVSSRPDAYAQGQIENQTGLFHRVKNRLRQVQAIQNYCAKTPREIAFRTKYDGVIHDPIIAGKISQAEGRRK
jgi:hypothetical protein